MTSHSHTSNITVSSPVSSPHLSSYEILITDRGSKKAYKSKGINNFVKFNSNTIKCLIVGPSDAGKSALLLRFKFHSFEVTVPTLGCVTETLKASTPSISITFCDLGNDVDQVFKKMAHSNADAIIFVVDAMKCSKSKKYQTQAKSMLHSYLSNLEFEVCVFLILANQLDKCDNPDEVTAQVQAILELDTIRSHVVEYKGCSVKDGLNIRESERWIVTAVQGMRFMLEQGRLMPPLPSKSKKQTMSKLPVSKLYSQSYIAPDVFRYQLHRGTLPYLDFPDIIRSIFSFLIDAFASNNGSLKQVIQRLAYDVHILFRLPFSLLSNTTAVYILVSETASCIQKFTFQHGKLPTDFDFCTVFLSEHAHLLNLDVLWTYISTSLLFNTVTWQEFQWPDLRLYPFIWGFPDFKNSMFQPHPHLTFIQHCFHLLRQTKKESQSRSVVESKLVDLIPSLGCTSLLFWTQLMEAEFTLHPLLMEDEVNFKTFGILCPELLNPLHWMKYYSRDAWESQEALTQFIIPDLQMLPNVLKPPSSPLPNLKKLRTQFKRPYDVDPGVLKTPKPTMNHLEFLFVLHDRLRPFGTLSMCDVHAAFLFLLQPSGPSLIPKGSTHLYFWVYLILLFMMEVPRDVPTATFLDTYPILLWSDAWSLYYSLDYLWSKAGITSCLEPDLKPWPMLHLLGSSEENADD